VCQVGGTAPPTRHGGRSASVAPATISPVAVLRDAGESALLWTRSHAAGRGGGARAALPSPPVPPVCPSQVPAIRTPDGALRSNIIAPRRLHAASPKVFLASLGPLADFTARATYAKKFFEGHRGRHQ
jgi:hypothetical protein